MPKQEEPYIGNCGFCGDGMLRFMRCHECRAIVAVCDECELIWQDVQQVSDDPKCPAASSFPNCPVCQATKAKWSKAKTSEIQEAALDGFIAGTSV